MSLNRLIFRFFENLLKHRCHETSSTSYKNKKSKRYCLLLYSCRMMTNIAIQQDFLQKDQLDDIIYRSFLFIIILYLPLIHCLQYFTFLLHNFIDFIQLNDQSFKYWKIIQQPIFTHVSAAVTLLFIFLSLLCKQLPNVDVLNQIKFIYEI